MPHHIVVLRASADAVVSRALARAREAVTRGAEPRKDDNEATLRRRLVEYQQNKNATLGALRQYLRIAEIDGGGSRDEVALAIGRFINHRR